MKSAVVIVALTLSAILLFLFAVPAGSIPAFF